MKYIRGFLMAWGMFCWIPCPYKGWREEDRDAQISMLPLTGACIGAITCLIWFCLKLLDTSPVLTGTVLTGSYFLLTGFIHLDGYMDCSDAVMPRHPKMEERRRILKDSHTGAFGAICLVLMLFIVCASWISLADKAGSDLSGNTLPEMSVTVIMIMTISRTLAAVSVLNCRPMETSQYAGAWSSGEKGATILAVIWGALFTAAALWLSLRGAGSPFMQGAGTAAIAAVVTLISGLITGAADRSRLGGMNGDISGHMITTSEMFGMLTMALFI